MFCISCIYLFTYYSVWISCFLLLLVCLLNAASSDQSEHGKTSNDTDIVSEGGDYDFPSQKTWSGSDDFASGSQDDHLET